MIYPVRIEAKLIKVSNFTDQPQVKVPVDPEIVENDQQRVAEGHSPWRLDPAYVAQVFLSLKISPGGNEFKNKSIDQLLDTFSIDRSLSKKGCPYDNAVAEAAFKVVKTEFIYRIFNSFDELKYELFDYVNWYNNHRIHGSLDYLTPVEYRMLMSEKKLS